MKQSFYSSSHHPPKLPGLCSGISITLENKTSPVLDLAKTLFSKFQALLLGGCSPSKDVSKKIKFDRSFQFSYSNTAIMLLYTAQYAFHLCFSSFIQITGIKFTGNIFMTSSCHYSNSVLVNVHFKFWPSGTFHAGLNNNPLCCPLHFLKIF